MADSKTTSASSKTSNNGNDQAASEANVDLGAAASEASEQIQEQVSGLTQQVRQQASDQFETQKERLADTLDTVALLLRQAGEHADLQDKATLTGYVNKASSQVGQWSETLCEQTMTQLLDDTVQYARRQPMLFLSGALAAGFAGARFFRSSTQQPEEQVENTPAGEPDTTDTPHYATIQEAFESASTPDDMPQATGMSSPTGGVSDTSDFLDDYKAAALEGDEFIEDPLTGAYDPTSPENQ